MLEVKQIEDLEKLMDDIYEENHPEDKSKRTIYKQLISFATSKNEKNNNKLASTQIRNLENIAYTSNNLSDIKNYIKSQVGKDTKKSWSSILDNNKCFGQLLLEEIEKVEKKAREKHNSIEFKVKVVREFIHQFVSDYLYNTVAKDN
ncbi:MAG: hypothetical protein U0354_15505 [Candidatus Sericytochromatia bacterium]